MKFILRCSSSWDDWNTEPKTVEINTLDELLNLQKVSGHSIIIEETKYPDSEYVHPLRKEVKYTIEVYDDYRE